MSNLLTDEQVQGLAQSAQARSEADWLVGINATRALTLVARRVNPASSGTLSVGRVQTPTLGLIVERHKHREAFVSQDYWQMVATLDHKGEHFVVKLVDEDNEVVHIEQSKTATQMVTELQGQPWGVEKVEARQTTSNSPGLFDLTSLQRQANTKLGWTAQDTLKVAQALYERHKLLSYPRTDSRCMTPELAQSLEQRLAVAGQNMGLAPPEQTTLSKRIVNAAKVTDHHAIIPTLTSCDLSALSDQERALYEMVSRRTMAAVAPVAQFDETSIWVKVNGHTFFCKGRVTVETGWMQWEREQEEEDNEASSSLPSGLAQGTNVDLIALDAKKGKTKPKAAFTEASLLSAMENAGRSLDDKELVDVIKGSGLGTPATRASVIELLVARTYIKRKSKALLATDKGIELIDLLDGVEQVTDAHLTAQWELELEGIAQGDTDASDFMARVVGQASSLVNHIRTLEHSDKWTRPEPIGVCPACKGETMVMGQKFALCCGQDCEFKLWRTVCGKTLSETHVKQLLDGQTVGPIKGLKSKQGRTFEKKLALDNQRIVFVSEKIQTMQAACPRCDTSCLMIYPKMIRCESCDFGMWRNLAGKELTLSQLEQLLTKKTVGPLKGFKSSQTKKSFEATLVLADVPKNPVVKFEFASSVSPLGAKCPQCSDKSLSLDGKEVQCGGCAFKFWSFICQRQLKPTELDELFEKGRVGPLDGFKSKAAKSFSTALVLCQKDQRWEVEFDFGASS